MAKWGHTRTSVAHLAAVRRGNPRGRGRNLMNVTPAEREAIEPFADFCRRQKHRVRARLNYDPVVPGDGLIGETGLMQDDFTFEKRGRV